MTTATLNRVSKASEHKCSYRGCGKAFPSKQGLSMHIGRIHTKTIPTARSKKARIGRPPKIAVDGSLRNGHTTVKRKYKKRTKVALATQLLMPDARQLSGLDLLQLPKPDFCPKCGLRVGRFCGECGMDIKVLTVALYLAEKHSKEFAAA